MSSGTSTELPIGRDCLCQTMFSLIQNTNIHHRRTISQRNQVCLGRQNPINVDNNGGIVFQTVGSHSGSAKIGEIPVVS